jgi:hypothetical protein
MKTVKILASLFTVMTLFGCASTITAKPSGESGIPYYLPNPYLLMAKNISLVQTKTITKTIKEEKKETIETTAEPITQSDTGRDFFSFQVIYLPDLTQKYGIEILSRTGTIDTTVTLIDGWKFTGLNLKADAKTSETINAIGSVVSKLPFPVTKAPIDKGLMEPAKEAEAGLWLYEIRVEDGRIKYDLVIEWKP